SAVCSGWPGGRGTTFALAGGVTSGSGTVAFAGRATARRSVTSAWLTSSLGVRFQRSRAAMISMTAATPPPAAASKGQGKPLLRRRASGCPACPRARHFSSASVIRLEAVSCSALALVSRRASSARPLGAVLAGPEILDGALWGTRNTALHQGQEMGFTAASAGSSNSLRQVGQVISPEGSRDQAAVPPAAAGEAQVMREAARAKERQSG